MGTRFPSIVNSQNTSGAATSPFTITLPTGIVLGQLLVVILARAGTAGQTFTFPSGWAEVVGANGANGTTATERVFWKRATATEVAAAGSTISVSSSVTTSQNRNAITLLINNAKRTGTPIFSGTAVAAATANPNPPNCAPGLGALDFLWLPFSVGATVSAYGANYGTGLVSTGTPRIYMPRRTLNAASEDPAAFTAAAATHIVQTLAIQGEPTLGDSVAVSQQRVEVVFDKVQDKVRVSKQQVEVAYGSVLDKVRVSKQQVEVVISVNDLEVTATPRSAAYII